MPRASIRTATQWQRSICAVSRNWILTQYRCAASMDATSDKRPDMFIVAPSITIRCIYPHEGAAMRAIRVSALADTPQAFGQTLAQAMALTDVEYDRRAQASARGRERTFIVAEDRQAQWIGSIAGHD